MAEGLSEISTESGDRLEDGDIELLVIGAMSSLYIGALFFPGLPMPACPWPVDARTGARLGEGDSALFLVEPKNRLQNPEEVVTMAWLTYESLLPRRQEYGIIVSGIFHKRDRFRLRRMAGRKKVPRIVVQRLPLYLRALSTLKEGAQITSQELGEMLGISSAQIRKDLSYFGGFGKQGTGYQVGFLREKLRGILNVDREWGMALVGVGDLGHAIARYGGFKREGFHVVAAFDDDPTKIGKRVGGLEIMDVALLPEVVNRMGLRVGIIAVPASNAQEVATILVTSGIKAILNYAPVALTVPEEVQVYQIDPLVGLQSMTHYLEG